MTRRGTMPSTPRHPAFLRDRVSRLDAPRAIGGALLGAGLGDLWKHRVGDDRIIASMEDGTVRILLGRIG